jgi:hypothetical protein
VNQKAQRRFKTAHGAPLTTRLLDIADDNSWRTRAELIIEKRSGKVRQAGASRAEGEFVVKFRQTCERSLYAFLRGVLNHYFLDPTLHKPVCDWLTTIPPYRKMLLMPRNHGKTTIVAQGIPLHAIIQPAETNVYFKNMPGTDLRLVLAGETEEMAVRNLRFIKMALENNALLRALWPHVVWENPRRQAPKWSDDTIIIPRTTEFAEPTIRAIGVGGAITGMHPIMLIKDDLTTQKAANEPPTMAKAIEWHTDSRALLANPDTDLEFITGTRWANFDLPGFIEETDKTVEVNKEWRRIVDTNGNVLWPYKFGYEGAVAQLKAEHGIKFNLLYMNEAVGDGLTDFLASDLREYELRGGAVVFRENEHDEVLRRAVTDPAVETRAPRGMDLYTALTLENLEYLRNTRSL